MKQKTILLSGSSAVGKTAVLKHILKGLEKPCVCKIDCIETEDDKVIKELGFPCVVGIGGDVCPDHFLVSNLVELWNWSKSINCPTLIIETAGLCHRCSPATNLMVAGCVVDCTSSSKAPKSLGPMVSKADFIVLTKIDMISQAEREIFIWNLSKINDKAKIFPIDSIAGYGIEELCDYLASMPFVQSYEGDKLRHTMPSGICSYCIGETRVGDDYQQGVVEKIDFQ